MEDYVYNNFDLIDFMNENEYELYMIGGQELLIYHLGFRIAIELIKTEEMVTKHKHFKSISELSRYFKHTDMKNSNHNHIIFLLKMKDETGEYKDYSIYNIEETGVDNIKLILIGVDCSIYEINLPIKNHDDIDLDIVYGHIYMDEEDKDRYDEYVEIIVNRYDRKKEETGA